jgi:hypothetical protein
LGFQHPSSLPRSKANGERVVALRHLPLFVVQPPISKSATQTLLGLRAALEHKLSHPSLHPKHALGLGQVTDEFRRTDSQTSSEGAFGVIVTLRSKVQVPKRGPPVMLLGRTSDGIGKAPNGLRLLAKVLVGLTQSVETRPIVLPGSTSALEPIDRLPAPTQGQMAEPNMKKVKGVVGFIGDDALSQVQIAFTFAPVCLVAHGVTVMHDDELTREYFWLMVSDTRPDLLVQPMDESRIGVATKDTRIANGVRLVASADRADHLEQQHIVRGALKCAT